jgi:serine/threonine-protein kinase
MELHDAAGRELRRVLTQPKRFALLVYLAAGQSRFQRRDTLLGTFWPNLDAAHARDALNQAIRFLRKELGGSSESIIVSRGSEELGVDGTALWCDAAAFRAAVDGGRQGEALELYRGDLLPGFYLERDAGFEEWLERERTRLRASAAQAARVLASACENDARFTTAVSSARRAVELSSVDERIVRELLELLDRLGDRAGAIHAYEEFARRLSSEYDAEPGSETKAVAARIRTHSNVVSTRRETAAVGLDRPAHTYRPPLATVDTQPRAESLIDVDLHGWHVEREIGRGGMATVYLARDVKHARHVALKALRSDLSFSIGVERFLREIQIMARLAHPHILPLIDSGASNGVLYLVTPYIAGESLRQRLRREGRLSIDDALAATREVAAALDYAHRHGVIHRDVKPENILLQDGQALVADFGIAHAISAAASDPARSAGMVAGTPWYMSPEQATGDEIDPRSDVYSLGATLYEMLTGTPPHAGDNSPAVGSERRPDPPVPVSAVRPDVSTAVDKIIQRALATDPGDRFPTMAAFTRALDESAIAADGRVSHVNEATRAADIGLRSARRARRIAALVSIAAVSGGAIWINSHGAQRIFVEHTAMVVASPDLELDPAISPDGKRVAYASGPFDASMKVYVRSIEGGPPVLLAGDVGGNQRWPRWSPDGKQILFVDARMGRNAGTSAYVVSASGGSPKLVIESPTAQGLTPSWSPDGTRIAYSDNERIIVQPLTGEAATTVATGHQVHSPVFSPDGKRLAYVVGNHWGPIILNIAASSVCTVSVSGGRSTCLTDTTHSNASPAWAPDSRSVLYVSNLSSDGDIYEQPLSRDGSTAGPPVRVTTGLGASSISLSADGSRGVYSLVRLRSEVWSAPIANDAGPAPSDLRLLTKDAQATEGLDVSRDGKWLVYDSNRGGNQNIYKLSIDGGEPIRLTGGPAPDFDPRLSPDGREIAYYSMRGGKRQVRLMLADGTSDHAVTRDSLQEGFADWAPDSRQLVFMSGWGSPEAVFTTSLEAAGDWSAPRRLRLEAEGQDNAAHPRWSPDGKWIAYLAGRGSVYVVSPLGGIPRRLAGRSELGRAVRFIVWDSDTSLVCFVGGGDQSSFWSVPISSAVPHELLRLSGPQYRRRREEFAVAGNRLFFTLSSDESDIWMMTLRRGR